MAKHCEQVLALAADSYDIPDEKEETYDITKDKLITVLNEHTPGKSWTNNDFFRVHQIQKGQAKHQ